MKTIYIESIDENCKPETACTYEKFVIRKPRLPKVAKVKRYKQVGARLWSTMYRVKDELSNILYSSEVEGEAIDWARKRTMKDLKKYYICVDKALTNSDPLVAEVSPGKFRCGRYKFIILEK